MLHLLSCTRCLRHRWAGSQLWCGWPEVWATPPQVATLGRSRLGTCNMHHNGGRVCHTLSYCHLRMCKASARGLMHRDALTCITVHCSPAAVVHFTWQPAYACNAGLFRVCGVTGSSAARGRHTSMTTPYAVRPTKRLKLFKLGIEKLPPQSSRPVAGVDNEGRWFAGLRRSAATNAGAQHPVQWRCLPALHPSCICRMRCWTALPRSEHASSAGPRSAWRACCR